MKRAVWSRLAAIALTAAVSSPLTAVAETRGPAANDPCDFLAKLVEAKGWDALDKLSKALETAESLETFRKRRGNVGPSRESWLDNDPEVSRVDINGDGIRDFRLSWTAGTMLCEDNEFRKGKPDGSVGPTIGLVPRHEPECGFAAKFFRLAGKTYLVKAYANAPEVVGLGKYGFQRLCRLRQSYPALRPVPASCPGPICAKFATLVPSLYENWRQIVGARALTEAERTQWLPGRVADQIYDKDYDGAFFVDIDNDGVDEIYTRYRGGRGFQLSYRMFKHEDGRYRRITPNERYANFDLVTGTNEFYGGWYDWSETVPNDITFVRLGGKTYVVTVAQRPLKASPRVDFDYTLLFIKDGRTTKVGTARLPARLRIRIDRRMNDDCWPDERCRVE